MSTTSYQNFSVFMSGIINDYICFTNNAFGIIKYNFILVPKCNCEFNRLNISIYPLLSQALLDKYVSCFQKVVTCIKYFYACARWKQSSGKSFLLRVDWLQCSVCDTVQLVLIRFWRTGHGRVVKALAITVGGGRCLWDSEARVGKWAPTREEIRSYLEFTPLPVHGTCSHVSSKHPYNIYIDIYIYMIHAGFSIRWYEPIQSAI